MTHITVYILSDAMLGAVIIAAVMQLVRLKRGEADVHLLKTTDNLLYGGLAFLILGMLVGALLVLGS